MPIVQTINVSDFHQAFVKMDRENNFSYSAKESLFEHIESLSDDTGENTELDVIAICCEYSEVNIVDYYKNYLNEDMGELKHEYMQDENISDADFDEDSFKEWLLERLYDSDVIAKIDENLSVLIRD